MVQAVQECIDLLGESPVPPKKPGKSEQPKRVRKRDTGEVVPLNIEITPEKNAAIEACRAKLRWTKKVLVDAALDEFLEKHGFWPPPAESQPSN